MADTRRLTAEQWARARLRWEGSDLPGFDWLVPELAAAFGVTMTRQGVSVRAKRDGWKKGGEPSKPLVDVAQHGKADVAQRAVVAQQTKPSQKPGAEPVDLPPGEKPVGYAGTGRPTLYRPEYDAMIVAYFDKEPFTEVDVEQASGVVRRQRMATDPPMLAGFAKSIGVTRETVNNWATEVGPDGRPRYPSFSDAYAHARELNESMLVRGGMLGAYEGKFSVFVMKNLYGWQDQPARSVAVAPVSAEELDRLYGERMQAAYERRMAVLAERRHLLEGG
jgi:hypothetical protein